MKEKPKLNGKTPKWFEEWHNKYFEPVQNTTNSNKRWIYIIVAAIVAAAVSGNFDISAIAKVITAVNGGG